MKQRRVGAVQYPVAPAEQRVCAVIRLVAGLFELIKKQVSLGARQGLTSLSSGTKLRRGPGSRRHFPASPA